MTFGLAHIPEPFVVADYLELCSVGYFRPYWCATCGCVNRGGAWFSANNWCPSCSYEGVPVSYRAIRAVFPTLPSHPRNGSYIPLPGWEPFTAF